MDATAILENVARRYAHLKTLSVDMISITESGDAHHSNRNSQKTKAWFEAPHKVRIEQTGPHGKIVVTNGVEVVFYFGRNHYSKAPQKPEFRQGEFRIPVLADAFLFARIAENISSVRLLNKAPGSVVLAVIYEPPKPQICWFSAPVRFTVDSGTNLISRVEAEVSIRMPTQSEAYVQKHAISYDNAVIDQPIPPETFELIPPEDDVVSRPRLGRVFSGSPHVQERTGETLTERYKLQIHGVELSIERRYTFSEDRRQLKIAEMATGPKGTTTHDFTLPWA